MYKSLNTIFSKLENKDALNYLTYHVGNQLNLEEAKDFFSFFNKVEDKSIFNLILDFCEIHNFTRIPSSSLIPCENGNYYKLSFETENYYLSFDNEDLEKNSNLSYFFKNKITKEFDGQDFDTKNPPKNLLDYMKLFPNISIEYKRDIPIKMAWILDFLTIEFPFLTSDFLYGFISNASYNANEIGECDEDLEHAHLVVKDIITKEDIKQALENDDFMKYYTLINDLQEFKTLKKGWFDSKEDGDPFDHDFLDQTSKYLCCILRDINFSHNYHINSNEVYIYPCPDGEISIEMVINNNHISLEFRNDGGIYSVFIHSVNLQNHKSDAKTFLIEDYKEMSLFLYNIIKGEKV